MSEAMLKSIEILHENKDKIAEESNRIKYGDLLSLRFKKLNKVGIRASKKRVVEGGHISVIPSFEDNIIYILKAESESSYEESRITFFTPIFQYLQTWAPSQNQYLSEIQRRPP